MTAGRRARGPVLATAAAGTVPLLSWRAGSARSTSRRRDTNAVVASNLYRGADVPTPGDERVRRNLSLSNGAAPTNAQSVEVTVESFTLTP